MHLLAYFILCLIAAIIGSRRVLGFWGFLLLSVALTPIVTFVILILGASRKKARA